MRGFGSNERMHQEIIERWNEVVPEDGLIFILGDISFGKPEPTIEVLQSLNGMKVLVRGNHDKHMKSAVAREFSSIWDYLEIDVVEAPKVKQRIVMLHYAMRVWNRSHFGAWHLYGHSHGNLNEWVGRSMDVGLDPNGLRPVSYKQVKWMIGDRQIHCVDHHAPKEVFGE
jgi:calcineurin-like phosphoesterase family protein